MKYLSILILSILLFACKGEKNTNTQNKQTKTTPPVNTVSPQNTPPPAAPPVKTQEDKGEKIHWMTFEEAQKKLKDAPRKILVDVYTPWCGPCKLMMRTTFTDPELIKYLNENYYTVKFNGESGEPVTFKGKTYKNPNYNPAIPQNRRNSQHELTRHLRLRGYPTLFIFDAKLNKLKEIVGMKSASQLMNTLKQLE